MENNKIRAYLLGAIHDATYNKKHQSIRITQTNQQWLILLKSFLKQLRNKSWMYKEGKNRKVYALETTAKFLDLKFDPLLLNKKVELDYVRGYFDAEGGIPRNQNSKFYIQFVQKNKNELIKVMNILQDNGIVCGKIHIPSVKIDPDYYRFYILSESHKKFIKNVGSWHPRKKKIFELRMKI